MDNESTEGGGLFIGAGFFADLSDKLDSIAKHTNRDPAVYQIPIMYSPITGSNLVDNSALLAPVREVCWSVRRLICTGFTAGTVSVQINQIEPITFTQPGIFTFGRGEVLLQPGDRFTIQPNTITGTATLFGAADVFPFWYLRYYLS